MFYKRVQKRQDFLSKLEESGRSMVEMLAVLAIMAILSIISLYAYKVAINKHRANTILNEAMKRAVLLAAHRQVDGVNVNLSEMTDNDLGFATFSSDVITDGLNDRFGIQVSGIESELCMQLLSMSDNDSVIRRLATATDLMHSTDCQNSDKSYVMIFNNNLGAGSSDPAPIECAAEQPRCALNAVIGGTETQCACLCPEGREIVNGRCGDCAGEVEKYVAWTQPILSANGTMGGDSFAARESSNHLSCQGWRAFSNWTEETYSGWHSNAGQTLPQWIAWYNPNPLKIHSISIKNRNSNDSIVKDFELQYSDDDNTWITAMTGTNTQGVKKVSTFGVNSSEGHKYWRIYVTSSYGSNWVFIDTISLVADELSVGEGVFNPDTLLCE